MKEWPHGARPYRSNPPDGAVGIVLPIRNDMQFFKLCYHSLLAFTDYRFMLTIVDNESTIKTWQYLESIRRNHNINVLQYQKEHNLSGEWNLGLRFMTSFVTVRYAVCLTPTFVLEPYWLSTLVRRIDSDDKAYALKTNAGVQHAVGFSRGLYDKINGFNEKEDPVVDLALRAGFETIESVYAHKFQVNGFDPKGGPIPATPKETTEVPS